MTQRWEAMIFLSHWRSSGVREKEMKRKPLPEPDQGALSTRCGVVESSCSI